MRVISVLHKRLLIIKVKLLDFLTTYYIENIDMVPAYPNLGTMTADLILSRTCRVPPPAESSSALFMRPRQETS